jgi:hypothetical protein
MEPQEVGTGGDGPCLDVKGRSALAGFSLGSDLPRGGCTSVCKAVRAHLFRINLHRPSGNTGQSVPGKRKIGSATPKEQFAETEAMSNAARLRGSVPRTRQ